MKQFQLTKKTKKCKLKTFKNNKVYVESYDVLILSPGSTPLKPPIPGIDSPNIFSLWNIPDVDRIKSFVDNVKPKSVAVIGGGIYRTVKWLRILHDLGMEGNVVEMADQVMAPVDFEMAQIVHRHMKN